MSAARLPHRPPYVLIEGVALEASGQGRGWAPVASEGQRSPAQLIEIAAQVCAALEAEAAGAEIPSGVLAAVRGFELPALAPQGPLQIEARQSRALGDQRLWRVEIYAEGEAIAYGALIFSR
ncbi:hypothetical protein KKF91_01110 [Myxococcota bacterium]|nr:hypothetical protein [Myxococcota bacterium]MBU1429134.1 hypothetical protein [Myxococcota bacterium]MBU1897398.1 hypothetical protein [Myxococcota bacterium]